MVTVQNVLDLLAGALHVAGGAGGLQGFWTAIATPALNQALRDVQGALFARGFSLAQLGTWTAYDPTVLQQALYWTLTYGSPMLPEGVNDRDKDALDMRKTLPAVMLYDNSGNRIVPALDVPGVTNQPVGRGSVSGGWNDVKAKDPNQGLGFVDPRTGRMRPW